MQDNLTVLILYWSKKESKIKVYTMRTFRKNVKNEEGSSAFDEWTGGFHECRGSPQRAFIRSESRSLSSIDYRVREEDDSKTRLPQQRD
jgi:hypothetical protein